MFLKLPENENVQWFLGVMWSKRQHAVKNQVLKRKKENVQASYGSFPGGPAPYRPSRGSIWRRWETNTGGLSVYTISPLWTEEQQATALSKLVLILFAEAISSGEEIPAALLVHLPHIRLLQWETHEELKLITTIYVTFTIITFWELKGHLGELATSETNYTVINMTAHCF